MLARRQSLHSKLSHSAYSVSQLVIVRHRVHPSVPVPGRTALSLVQAALKVDKSIATKLIHDGAVSCDGKLIVQTHWKMNAGDELEIDYAPQPVRTPAKSKRAKAGPQRFEIAYDDEALMVVNKPAGLLTVPSPHREKNTLLSQVQKWLNQKQPGTEPICVHRLDRGVSGLLVFPKNEEVADALRGQFSKRKPKRVYTAFVAGTAVEQSGTIRSYLATDEQSLNRYSVRESEAGELAITHFELKEQWTDVALLSIQLETGRRNQIRVHLAEQGHPIIGDPRYRPREAAHPAWPHKRIALHAETLGFEHPVTGESLRFQASWPEEFRAFRRKMSGSKK